MNDYQSEINRAVFESGRRYDEHLEELLAAVPVGWLLCVHEVTRQDDFALDRDRYTFTVRAQAHALPADVTCDAEVRRTQYGPKTAEIQALRAIASVWSSHPDSDPRWADVDR